MLVDFATKKEVLIIKLSGELDHHSAEEVRNHIDDKIEREKSIKVIMDFENVTFMDSSGIGVVIGRYKKILSQGGEIVITSATDNIKRVFELSGIFKIIKYYKNLQDAYNAVTEVEK